MLGLPDAIAGLLFDLDGVLTDTASVHAAAWKQMFDDYLRQRADRTGEAFVPFDLVQDYGTYVDGKPRYDGVKSFLASRGIQLPQGAPSDPPAAETIDGLGNRKNEIVLAKIKSDGVKAYPGSVRYLDAAKTAGVPAAVVSSSTNAKDVLHAAGIDGFFTEVVDGVVADREKLNGKPAPDTYLAGARALGLEPAAAAVFEDALAGVEAGHAGGFGAVVGVNRISPKHSRDLAADGATVVVDDLAELLDNG
jgi:beta-phosphoglucomutase family hydrolase